MIRHWCSALSVDAMVCVRCVCCVLKKIEENSRKFLNPYKSRSGFRAFTSSNPVDHSEVSFPANQFILDHTGQGSNFDDIVNVLHYHTTRDQTTAKPSVPQVVY